MSIILLRYTPEPDKIVALAARRCYSNRAARDIEDKMSMMFDIFDFDGDGYFYF